MVGPMGGSLSYERGSPVPRSQAPLQQLTELDNLAFLHTRRTATLSLPGYPSLTPRNCLVRRQGKPLHYKGSKFHRVIPEFMCQVRAPFRPKVVDVNLVMDFTLHRTAGFEGIS